LPDAARERWRDLVERRLPQAARPDWPVHRDHCFARILLDNTCGGPWRDSVRAPAWANLSLNRLDAATGLGEAILDGRTDLDWLNRRSLSLRGKLHRAGALPVPPDSLRDGDLVLRPWQAEDEAALASLSADPEVMRYFLSPHDAEESRAEARGFAHRFRVDGFGPWAVTMLGEGCVGLVGGARVMRVMPFPGGERPGETVELEWRLARSAWGRGLATRAARLALLDLFGRCGLSEVVAFTAVTNAPSRRVMNRLGMEPAGGFDHPALPPGHPLEAHLLYRLTAASFESGRLGA